MLGFFLRSAVVLVLWGAADVSAQAVHLDSVPVGRAPIGVDVARFASPFSAAEGRYAVVANSGDQSVSIFELKGSTIIGDFSILPPTVVPQVPTPYAVTRCRMGDQYVEDHVLVTSPSDSSVSILRVPDANILGTIHVGPLPYAAVCFSDATGPTAVVSLRGDNSLALIDLQSFAVTARIPEVAGSRGLRGVAVARTQQGHKIAWVAGTDANVVTLVDLTTLSILTCISAQKPTVVTLRHRDSEGAVGHSECSEPTGFCRHGYFAGSRCRHRRSQFDCSDQQRWQRRDDCSRDSRRRRGCQFSLVRLQESQQGRCFHHQPRLRQLVLFPACSSRAFGVHDDQCGQFFPDGGPRLASQRHFGVSVHGCGPKFHC